MKYRRSTDYSDKHHLFLYGYPGCGKTKAARDYYEALGQGLVVVSNENRAESIFAIAGIDVPVLAPETLDELRAIISMPVEVVEKIVKEKMGYTFEVPHTFLFDNIRMTQLMIFGEGPQERKEVFDGAIVFEPEKPKGIMALPNKRDHAGLPSNKDYRFLDMEMRKVVDRIDRMPYHTIVTTHAEEDFSAKTKMATSGLDINTKEGKREWSERNIEITGYPSLEGFSLKADLPGLVSDLFLYLYWDGNRYYACPKPFKGWYARTTMAEVMPPQIDWTSKNMYEIIEEKRKQARSK